MSTHSERLRAQEFWAVDEVSFAVEPGECLGIIGPNGAGKSTMLKMLNGILAPDRGCITVRGRVGALIEVGAGFHPLLTGRENIYVNGAILGMSKREIDRRLDEIIAFSGLEEFIDTPVKNYSSGMYVRLGFSVAAHVELEVLLVDEVLSVGDTAYQAKCLNKIGQMRDMGTAIVFVSHNMHHVSSFCNRVVYLNHGVPEHIGEPGAALAAYTADMISIEASSNGDDSDMGQVRGTGRIVIMDISFLDRSGTPVKQIRCGDSVTVRVSYRSSGDIENPLLDVAIRDSTPGNLFQATNRDYGIELGRIGRSGYVDIVFKSINANNQLLNFFSAFWNSDHTELFDWKRYVKLQVVGNPASSGRIMLDCEWCNVAGNSE